MKKTAGTKNSVRANTTPTRTGKTSPSTRASSSRKSSGGKKNKNGIGMFVAAVAVVAAVGAGIYGLSKISPKQIFEEKLTVTQQDGTTIEMTADELKKVLSTDKFFTGIHIDGIDVSGLSKEEAKALVGKNQPEQPVAMNIKLDVDGTEYPLDMSSLPLEWNIDTVIDDAYMYNRTTDLDSLTNDQLLAKYYEITGMANTPYECNTAYTVKTEGISSIVHNTLDSLIVEKKDAQLLGFDVETLEFTIDPSVEGVTIDIDSVINEVKSTLDSRTYEAVIPVEIVADIPDITTEMLTEGYGMISEAHSKTTTSNSRNHNIRITCEKIDGMILNPGDSFSYNGTVGQRTPENGYQLAGVIYNGETQEDYGGGICQLSSMMYQAVIKADLQVDERHPHTWPSSYTTEGTDAAVDWGSLDFKFTNNSDYPIVIHAYYNNDEYKVTVEIYGHLFEDGQYIEFIGERTSYTSPSDVEYVANPEMAVGTTNSVRAAHAAISARAYQVWYDANGNEIRRVECDSSYYPMIKQKIEVGVLNEDGSIAPMDTTTGEVTTPEPTPTESTDPSDTTPSDTIPSDTTPSDVTPTDTIVPTDTAAPTETVPPETQPTEAPTEATTVATEAPTEPAPVETQAPETPSEEA